MRITAINSEGEKIVISDEEAPIVLTSIQGLGAPDGDIHSVKVPMRDGAIWIANTAQTRQIAIEGAIVGSDGERIELRRRLIHAMNTKRGMMEIWIEAYGRERMIEAVVQAGPTMEEQEGEGIEWQKFTATLMCPTPWFSAASESSLNMYSREGGFRFPLSLGTRFVLLKQSSWYECQSGGDVPTGIRAEFTGEGEAPTILNMDTGEFIRINRAIPEGKSLVITTGFNNKRAYLTDESGAQENAMGYLDLASNFFELEPGINRIRFEVGGESTSAVKVSWRDRYASF